MILGLKVQNGHAVPLSFPNLETGAVHFSIMSCDTTLMVYQNGTQFMVIGLTLICSTTCVRAEEIKFYVKSEAGLDISE